MSNEPTVRAVLDPDHVSASARAKVAGWHRSVVEEVATAVSTERVVVVGMAQNPHVKRARRALDAAGVAYRYLEFGSYLGGWKPRLAVKMWSGWPTFPQVFLAGSLVGGADETEAAIQTGSLAK